MSLFTSVLSGGANNHETTAEEVNALATDFVSEGVVGAITNTSGVAPMTGAFAVNEQDTPAMAVDVSAGIAYVTATPTGGSSQTLRVKSTAVEEVIIAANSTGSPRYDWIYIKIDPDKAADPAADGSDVATLVTSRSTSSSSDDGTPPTYGYPIAVVTVANGASSITDANIADIREVTGSTPADGSVTAAKIGLSTQSYTPVLTATSSNPNIGSTGTITGKYTQIGKWTVGEVFIHASGTGISAGSGSYLISLPTAVSSFHVGSNSAGEASSIGVGYFRDDGTSGGSLTFVTSVYSLTGGSGGVGQVAMAINAGRIITNSQTNLDSNDRFSLNFAYMAP